MVDGKQGLIRPYASQFVFIARLLDSFIIVLAALGSASYLGLNTAFPSSIWLAGLSGAVAFHLFADFTSLYRSWRGHTLWAETIQVFQCWSVSLVLCSVLGYLLLSPDAEDYINFNGYWFVLVFAGLVLWRQSLRLALRALRRRGFNSRKTAIVGTGKLARLVAQRLSGTTWMGYDIQGFFDDRQKSLPLSERCRRAAGVEASVSETVGSFNTLIEEAESGKLDCIYIALPMRAESRIQDLVDRLSNSTASVYVVPDLFVFELMNSRQMNLNGLPAFSLVGDPLNGWSSWVKRVEDIILSSLILLLISLPMILIALAVKLSSKGPVIFKQIRYGVDGKAIEVWKFRSMTVMENGGDFVQAKKNDVRVTKVGGFIRKTSLDELPQFINVLQGRMSIVGPRPHAVAHNEEFRGVIKGYMRRHKIKPGITGWAQINGWRGETDTLEKMEKRVEFDIQYLQHWSLWLDLKIIFMTVFKGFVDKNAY